MQYLLQWPIIDQGCYQFLGRLSQVSSIRTEINETFKQNQIMAVQTVQN